MLTVNVSNGADGRKGPKKDDSLRCPVLPKPPVILPLVPVLMYQ